MENNVITDYIMFAEEKGQDYLWQVYNHLESILGDKCEKTLAYQMPTYRAKKNVIYFVATKQHIGIYPGPEVIAAFEDQFGDYGYSKGTLKIKYNQEIPFDLLERMALYSYEMNK